MASKGLPQSKLSVLREFKRDHKLLRWGMQLLASKEDMLEYLEPMRQLGFFEPSENPGPQPADKEGYFSIPPWEAVDFLQVAAVQAVERKDSESIDLILDVLRKVTAFEASSDDPKENFRTWNAFAKILAVLPLRTYEVDDVKMLATWLVSRFDQGSLVGTVIGGQLLPKWLASDDPGEIEKIAVAIECVTKFTWQSSSKGVADNLQAVSAVPAYWLGELFKKSAATLGQKAGAQVSEILLSRMVEIYTPDDKDSRSWLWRPAIEPNSQNLEVPELHEHLINALRDVLIAYVNTGKPDAVLVVERMLKDALTIVRRIAVYVVDEHFDKLSPLFFENLESVFQRPLHHEVYRLLSKHFAELPAAQQSLILKVIDALGQSAAAGDEAQAAVKRDKLRWLGAIYQHGNAEADVMFAELSGGKDMSFLGEHPDFLSYRSFWVGKGVSPYSVTKLKSMEAATLILKLNGFEQKPDWFDPKNPTVSGLTDVLEQAIKEEPMHFGAMFEQFLGAKPPYQYAVLSAFRTLWQSPGKSGTAEVDTDWNILWPELLNFCDKLIEASDSWNAPAGQRVAPGTPAAPWIPGTIGDLIKGAVRDSQLTLPETLFPQIISILEKLTDRQPGDEEWDSDDSMTRAINTPKGRCLEALFEFTNRICRVADRDADEHTGAWKKVESIFDREMAQCLGKNFEFSTLCGCYLAHLHYFDPAWVENNLLKIFPPSDECLLNWQCALQGMAYMPQHVSAVFQLLTEKDVVRLALERNIKGHHAKDKLLQHIATAYLLGKDSFDDTDGPISLVIKRFDIEEIKDVVSYLWANRDAGLSDEQVRLVIGFWGQCMKRADPGIKAHQGLLSNLGLLAAFLNDITDDQKRWLLTIAPFIETNYNSHFLLEYLLKILPNSPRVVGEITLEILEHHNPGYDFENRFEDIAKQLLEHGEVDIVRQICNNEGLLNLPAFRTLYSQLPTSSRVRNP